DVERKNFRNYRDLDHDGKMSRKEVELWLMPTDYDNIQAETEHLFHEADKNQDDQLTKEEILDKHDVFVGSQATDWGDLLLIIGQFNKAKELYNVLLEQTSDVSEK
ncbi:unnamed protein product, partial [Adineta steineri]